MEVKPIRYGIIGCGLIGHKRAAAIPKDQLVTVCDINLARAQELASLHPGTEVAEHYNHVLLHPDVDAVIVATTNQALAKITTAALINGKHVLVEKPVATHYRIISTMADLARRQGLVVRVGFNHRYHPAILQAHDLVENGTIGPLMFLRARYGHGGRLGYEKEWRANPKLSGGGELIDQGIHLIDLSRWFLGDFPTVEGHVETYFWNMPVEDNAFLSLRTAEGKTAWLHASCSEWKNLFSFEIYGRDGKLHIEGLGGSYGVEKLTYYKILPQMGPPETTSWDYPRGDESWRHELEEFSKDIRLGRVPQPGLPDALAALEIVEKIYHGPNLEPPHQPRLPVNP